VTEFEEKKSYVKRILGDFRDILNTAKKKHKTTKAKAIKFHVNFLVHRLQGILDVLEYGESEADVAVGDTFILQRIYDPLLEFWGKQL